MATTVAGIAALAAAAQGSVFFSFGDDNTPLEVQGVAPGESGAVGILQYGDHLVTRPVFSFRVDATMEGGAVSVFNATLEWDLEIGAVTDGVMDMAPVTGTFVFRDADAASRVDDADVIMSGTIGNATLLLDGSVGSLLSSSAHGLTYVPGPALTGADPVVTELKGPFDGAYALSDIQFTGEGERRIARNDSDFLGDFLGNASFSGSASDVPGPGGALALAALGATIGIGRQTRRP